MKAGLYIFAYLNRRVGLDYTLLIDSIIKSNNEYIRSIMDFFDEYISNLLKGNGRGIIYEDYSDVYLEPEEVAFIKITQNKSKFYEALREIYSDLIPVGHLSELESVIRFQYYLVPEFVISDSILEIDFQNNIPLYCYSLFTDNVIEIENKATKILINIMGFGSKTDFTKKKLIWARKSGTILNSTNIEIELREKNKISYDITNYSNEKSFNISLFENDRQKFEKFNSIKKIKINVQ